MAEKKFTIKRWTLATFWGWLLGVVLIIMLSSFLDSIGIEGMQFYLGIGMGAGVGFSQWISHRDYLKISSNWIWITALGMGIPFIVTDLLMSGELSYKLQWSVAFGALTVSLFQFIILKNNYHKTSFWIPGSFIGWLLAVATVFIMIYTEEMKGSVSLLLLFFLNLFLILSGGVVLGLATGMALKRMQV